MLYALDVGAFEQTLIRQATAAGQPIPDRVANAPRLQPGLELYLNAFFDLDSERTHGFSLSPIPWGSIFAYGQAYGLDKEQQDDLIYFVRKLDQAHLDRIAKKQKAQDGKGTTRPRRKA